MGPRKSHTHLPARRLTHHPVYIPLSNTATPLVSPFLCCPWSLVLGVSDFQCSLVFPGGYLSNMTSLRLALSALFGPRTASSLETSPPPPRTTATQSGCLDSMEKTASDLSWTLTSADGFLYAHLPIGPGRVGAVPLAWWLGQTMLAPAQCLHNHWYGHSSVWSMRFPPGSLPASHSLALPWTQGAPPCHVSSYLASSTLNTHMAALCSEDVTSQPYKFCPSSTHVFSVCPEHQTGSS